MNRPPFFPDAIFGWTFCVVLILLTVVAARSDLRTAKIPNRLTVSILAIGLLAGTLRGAFLAANGMQVWWLWKYDPGAVWLGVIDGLLFAVTGFLVAFTAMLLCWIFGLCGGGDVKLFGAVGAWVGVEWFPLIWIASVVFLFAWTIARILAGGMTPRKLQKSLAKLNQTKGGRGADQSPTAKPGKLRVTYSLPIALAVTVVVLWVFRVELQLAPPKLQPGPVQGASCHERLSIPVATTTAPSRRVGA